MTKFSKSTSGRQKSIELLIIKPAIVGPFGTRPGAADAVVKSYNIPTLEVEGSNGPAAGQTLATLGTPNISLSEVPTQAGLDYYIGFYTFITSDGWYLDWTPENPVQLNGHCELFDATGLEIYSMPVGMNVECTMKNYYFFVQQQFAAEFFARTDHVYFAFDASYPWYQCP